MDKLEGIKPGDRVRVTFEASVIDAGHIGEHPIRFRPDGGALDALPGLSIINQPTFHIERIEKPLAVGDRVRIGGFTTAGTILAIHDESGLMWVVSDNGGPPLSWGVCEGVKVS